MYHVKKKREETLFNTLFKTKNSILFDLVRFLGEAGDENLIINFSWPNEYASNNDSGQSVHQCMLIIRR